jgi:lipoprotein-anchoring transpeptidase ErfK/SrfK
MVKILITTLLLISSFMYTSNDKLILSSITDYLNINIENKTIIFVSIDAQKLYLIKQNIIIKSYSISSSEYGIGNKNGSNKTPLGLHTIARKIGEKTPINGRMIARVFTGETSIIYLDGSRSKTDDITSRILWLQGEEDGINKGENIDSFKRYIYIHGTSEEGLIGQPASHGCIRLKNKDVIDLYKDVAIGTLVLIL